MHERPVVETMNQARQAEPGPSVLVLLVVSLAVAAIALVTIWTVFFHS